MLIRTKILATVGPSSGGVETIRSLVQAGCDAFRINFSHGDEAQHTEFLANIRRVEAETDTPLAVVGDLCGPKIRTGLIKGGSVLLAQGEDIEICRGVIEGNAERISTTLDELIDEADMGQSILLDDGKLRLEVIETHAPERIVCRIAVGGVLASGKGVNLPQTDLRLSAMTEKDCRDVEWMAPREFDYVALSFVQRAEDVMMLRERLDAAGSSAKIVAKIEKPQALADIDRIIDVADVLMVARGDLGVEMALPAVPVTQKNITRLCHKAGKGCIIATQMLESMTISPTPTRAEVSDVANAVLDQADAVMLSGETAVGKYPVQTVKMMDSIVSHTQVYQDEHYLSSFGAVECKAAPTVAALAAAVREILNVEEIAAVAIFTIGGTTARIMAKSRLSRPILAMSPEMATVRRLCLYYGVESVQAKTPEHTGDILDIASTVAQEKGIASPGDKIVIISGRPLGKPGSANTLVVHTIN